MHANPSRLLISFTFLLVAGPANAENVGMAFCKKANTCHNEDLQGCLKATSVWNNPKFGDCMGAQSCEVVGSGEKIRAAISQCEAKHGEPTLPTHRCTSEGTYEVNYGGGWQTKVVSRWALKKTETDSRTSANMQCFNFIHSQVSNAQNARFAQSCRITKCVNFRITR